MRDLIEFADSPGVFHFPPTPIFKPASVAGIFVVLTGTRIDGLYTHWNGSRDVPHIREGCRACAAGMAVRWSGYISAVALDDGEQSEEPGSHGFLEITQAAWEQMVKIKADRSSWRGLPLFLRRKNAKRNSKVLVQLLKFARSLTLPPPEDGKAFIRRLYSQPANQPEASLREARQGG